MYLALSSLDRKKTSLGQRSEASCCTFRIVALAKYWSGWLFWRSFWARISFTGTVLTCRRHSFVLLLRGKSRVYKALLLTSNPSFSNAVFKSFNVIILRYLSSLLLSSAADPYIARLTIVSNKKGCWASSLGLPCSPRSRSFSFNPGLSEIADLREMWNEMALNLLFFKFDLTTTKLIQQPKNYKDSGFLLYLSHDYFQVHLGRTQQQVQPVLVEELQWRSEVFLVEGFER